MDEKSGLPPYSAQRASSESLPEQDPRQRCRGRAGRGFSPFASRFRGPRRARTYRILALAFLALLTLGQWGQFWRSETRAPQLSLERLGADMETCKKLQNKPKDPIGLGRDNNARYVGGAATLIRNATIWIGEPVEGTSEADARAGKGWTWVSGDVLLENGLVSKVETAISPDSLPAGTDTFDARGRLLTSGIIDMHSHVGVYSLPALEGNADGNELSDNVTPWARSIDAIYPFDKQFEVIKSGGVTTSLVLPGSGNNMGGEAFLVKHAVGPRNGRPEISARDLLADPDQNWRYMKMACGENAKRVYGSQGKRPFSRMGESYEFRHAFEQASAMIRKQDDWCAKAEAVGVESMDEYLPQEIFWESLAAALRGQVHINTHCYTVPDLEAMVDHTNEFNFPIRAFHHAHQTFLVPEILKRTWGGRPPSSALFADNMYYKTESYIGSEYAGKILYQNGLTPVYVSDNPVLNAQHVLFEAAKAYHYGLPYHAAMASVTTAPADDLGMGQRIGKVKAGFDADVVVWDSDPMSVGAAPVQVWIDGTAQFDDPYELDKPAVSPMVPDESLANAVDEPTEMADVVFTGITRAFLAGEAELNSDEPFAVAISGGKVACIGACDSEVASAKAAGTTIVPVKNGYLHNAYTAVGGMLGLNHIDAETVTDNGDNPIVFSRAVDGLLLDSKKLHVAHRYGVTRSISAPKYVGAATHYGTSAGFVTSATTSGSKGAVFSADVAVHYTLDQNVRGATSYSAAFGDLRKKLLHAVAAEGSVVPFSEAFYLRKVIKGDMVLALTVNSADGISSVLRVKSDVEKIMRASSGASQLRVAVIGGAESWMVADELAAADVGVVLSSLQSSGEAWDQRRALPGAPLTNGTCVDWLVRAGVTTAVGLKEDWELRDLGFAAGAAWRNSEGKLSEREALDLVSTNVFGILGASVKGDEGGSRSHFVVSEGSPLEVGSRIKAVGDGRARVDVYV